jgi:hypothetical protein
MNNFIQQHIGAVAIFSIIASAFGFIAYCSNSAQAMGANVSVDYDNVEINGEFAYQN